VLTASRPSDGATAADDEVGDDVLRLMFIESTIAQRIVRAKRTLAAARVPFEVPAGPDPRARLSSILEVIYLIFNEGHAATQGERWVRSAGAGTGCRSNAV
jgi:predicted RNA polymerase sigma factor